MSAPIENYSLEEKLPNSSRFQQLTDCPTCGAQYCIDAIRRGPAVIMLTSNAYRVICLACWHKAKKAKTEDEAIQNWNLGKEPGSLAKLRAAAGLSQEQLAELSGVGYGAISTYERGVHTPSPPNRRKLAAALGVSPSEL